MDSEQLVFNGIDGSSGDYLLPPLTPHEISALAQGEKLDPKHLAELRLKRDAAEAHFGVVSGDPTNLAEVGWGVIFAHDADPAVREALSPLLEHRRKQAEQLKPRYQEYTGVRGYRPGESKQQFLARHGVGPGPAVPDKVPYYLLIVGDPEQIPFRFQYQLDVQYAVGRIHFETLDEYDRYARQVVEAETRAPSPPAPLPGVPGRGEPAAARARQAVFFGVRNAGDRATQLSADHLVKPLADKVAGELPDWQVQTVLKDEATKARLSQLLGGAETPAFLFSASHGMGFPNGDPRQLDHQGALLCQDWPGPIQWRKPIPHDFYFAGDDIADAARLQGLIAFFFACYGAGTPRQDDFAHQAPGERAEIAPHAFLGRLPRRLLTTGRAGRGRPRRAGLGLLLRVATRRRTTGGVREVAARTAQRPTGGTGPGIVQRALRRAVLGPDQRTRGDQVRQGTERPGTGRHVDRQQRRPQLRDPRRSGGTHGVHVCDAAVGNLQSGNRVSKRLRDPVDAHSLEAARQSKSDTTMRNSRITDESNGRRHLRPQLLSDLSGTLVSAIWFGVCFEISDFEFRIWLWLWP